MTSTIDPHLPQRRPGAPDADGPRSYYGTPVVKEPEWTWEVPWYLFAGGLAGASSTLSLLARATGRTRTAERATLVAAGAALVSPVLLVKDLGRPSRFYNMLRVFKPTSAMSMGSWLLAVYGPVAAAAATLQLSGRLPRLRAVLGAQAGLLGLPMATYTAVLMADSAIPVWHEGRDHLPFVFAGSAAATAGAAALLLAPADEAAPLRRVVVGGVALEGATQTLMEKRLGEVAEPYDEGDAGRYAKAAKVLNAAGAALVAVSGGTGVRRAAGQVGAALVLGGGVCLRWSVFRAGFQSARDPRHVVGPQRERAARY
jgi:formate-dependent nitrite reductase membrane component NrfD